MARRRRVMVAALLLLGPGWAQEAGKLPRQQALTLAVQDALERGDLDSAATQLNGAMAQYPKDGGLFNLRGIVHARRNELGKARGDFQTAVRLSPTLTPAWQNLARACQQGGEDSCASDAWRHVLRAKPNDDEAHEALSELYERQGDFAALVSLVKGWQAQGTASVAALRRLVIAYERLRQPGRALETLQRIAEKEPNGVADLLEMARLAEGQKNYQEALGYLAHARDLEPGNARTHYLFGLVAGEMDLVAEAKRSLEKAVAADAENATYIYALGSVMLRTRDAAGAADYLKRYVAQKPADPNGHYALGVAYFRSGDYERAKQEMTIAETDRKIDAGANYYLGRIARIEGNLDEAKRRLQRAVEAGPALAGPHTELARVALAEHHVEEARTELAAALKREPEDFQANEQLLLLYRRTKDVRAAEQAERLKKLDEERSKRADLMLREIEVRP